MPAWWPRTARPQTRHAGFTLIEVAVSMIIVSVMLVAALTTMGAAARSRSGRYETDRARALAQALLSEIVQRRYADPEAPIFGREGGETADDRRTWDDIDDYEALSNDPPRATDGQPMTAYAGYGRTVTVANVDPTTLEPSAALATGVRRVEVTVTGPSGRTVTLGALRTEHSTLEQPPTLDTAYVYTVGIDLRVGAEANAAINGGVAVLNHRPVLPPDTEEGP